MPNAHSPGRKSDTTGRRGMIDLSFEMQDNIGKFQ